MGGAASKVKAQVEQTDMSGKIAIITGTSSGIGLVTAQVLFNRGAHIIHLNRSESKTKPLLDEQIAIDKNRVHFIECDLQSLASVEKAGLATLEKVKELQKDENNKKGVILIDNAGIMATPFRLSPDKLESQIATNHYGHFYLTSIVFPLLLATPSSRFLIVSSMAHNMAKTIDFETIDINPPEKKYSPWGAYAQTKLANILLCRELLRQAKDKGVTADKVYFAVAHPGYVKTEIQRDIKNSHNVVMATVLSGLKVVATISPEEGALTTLRCATDPELAKEEHQGGYFVPIGKPASTSAAGEDAELGKKLWEKTESVLKEQIKVKMYDFFRTI